MANLYSRGKGEYLELLTDFIMFSCYKFPDRPFIYAKVRVEFNCLLFSRLQILCDRLVDKFVSSGLMHRDYDRVKIHVTVMNTMFRKDPSGAAIQAQSGPRGAMKERESFDASNVLRVSTGNTISLCLIQFFCSFHNLAQLES